jgi:hypothetical protein
VCVSICVCESGCMLVCQYVRHTWLIHLVSYLFTAEPMFKKVFMHKRRKYIRMFRHYSPM